MGIFEENISFIALFFVKLLTPNYVVTWMRESSCFRIPFHSQSVKVSQTLLNPERQGFHPNLPLIWNKLIWKTSGLVRSKILELFFNRLTAYHIFSRQIWWKLPQQAQTQLSSKPKSFSEIVTKFTKSTENIVHFGRKDQLHSFILSAVVDSELCGHLNARKLLFQNTIPQSTC